MSPDIQLLLQKKATGELSMNQVYSNATGDGSFKGSFKDFMAQAVEKGWVDQGLNATSAVLHSRYGQDPSGALLTDTPCLEGFEKNSDGICVEIRQGLSNGAKIGIGVGILAIIGVAIYVSKNKK